MQRGRVRRPASAACAASTARFAAPIRARRPSCGGWRASASAPSRECYQFRLAYRPPVRLGRACSRSCARARRRASSRVDGRPTGARSRSTGSTARSTCRAPRRASALGAGRALSRSARAAVDRRARAARVRPRRRSGGDRASTLARIRCCARRWRGIPGIRTPGAWDGFELAVRAILGQQISVAAATTIAGRIASMFGSPLRGRPGARRGCFRRPRSSRTRPSSAPA